MKIIVNFLFFFSFFNCNHTLANSLYDYFFDFEAACPKTPVSLIENVQCLSDGNSIILNKTNLKSVGLKIEEAEEWIWVSEAAKMRMPLMEENRRVISITALEIMKNKSFQGPLSRVIDQNIDSLGEIEMYLDQARLELMLAKKKGNSSKADDANQKIKLLNQSKSLIILETPILYNKKLAKYITKAKDYYQYDYVCNKNKDWMYRSPGRGLLLKKYKGKICNKSNYNSYKKYSNRHDGNIKEYLSDVSSLLFSQLKKTDNRIGRYQIFLNRRDKINKKINSSVNNKKNKTLSISDKKLIKETVHDRDLISELLSTPSTNPLRKKGMNNLVNSWCRLNNRVLQSKSNSLLTDLAVNSALTIVSFGAAGIIAQAVTRAGAMSRNFTLAEKLRVGAPLIAVDSTWVGYDFAILIPEKQKECDRLERNIFFLKGKDQQEATSNYKECMSELSASKSMSIVGGLTGLGINLHSLKILNHLDKINPSRLTQLKVTGNLKAVKAAQNAAQKELDDATLFFSISKNKFNIMPADEEYARGAYIYLRSVLGKSEDEIAEVFSKASKQCQK